MNVDDSAQLSDPPSDEEEESALEPGPAVQPKMGPVEEIREGMRSKLAVGLAGLLAVIVVVALVTVIVSPSRSAAMNEVLDGSSPRPWVWSGPSSASLSGSSQSSEEPQGADNKPGQRRDTSRSTSLPARTPPASGTSAEAKRHLHK